MSGATDVPANGSRAVTLHTDSNLANVEMIGRAVYGMCVAAGRSSRDAARVELAVVEAVNNVCRHAYHGEIGHPVEIVFTAAPDGITLEVADHGTPMRASRVPVLEFDPTDLPRLPEGGMGLYLIHGVMDRADYVSVDGRNALIMSLRRAA